MARVRLALVQKAVLFAQSAVGPCWQGICADCELLACLSLVPTRSRVICMPVLPSIIAFVVCLALCDQMPVLSLFHLHHPWLSLYLGEEHVSCSHVCVPSKMWCHPFVEGQVHGMENGWISCTNERMIERHPSQT